MEKFYYQAENFALEIHWKGGAASEIHFISKGKENKKLKPDQANFLRSLDKYFNGKALSITVSIPEGTAFERKVWKAALEIPYGETRSYGDIARRIKRPKAFRAVGRALGKNPLPILIPCHRVLSSSGKLHGFSGGLDRKKFLLSLEADASESLQKVS